MLTQGHQQKYSTDTEQPSNTWEERVVNVDEGGEGGAHCKRTHPTAAVGPHVKAVLWLQTLARPPQRGF